MRSSHFIVLSIQKMNNKEEVKYCLRPSQNRSIRLRIHHRRKLVKTFVKWYTNEVVSEMIWNWNVDYMSYMQLEGIIRNEGYANIKFHDYAEEVHFNDEFAPNSDDEEVEADRVDDDVQVGSENVEDEVQVWSKNVEDEVHVWGEIVDPDYVGSEDDLDSASKTEYEHSDEIDDMDWTTFIPYDKLVDKVNNSDVDDDFDALHTPPASDDEEHERFPAYKSGDMYKFQLGMMFNNKEMLKDALKEYAMKMKKNVLLKKNYGKRMQAKITWLVKNFSHILRYNPDMKPMGLIVEVVDIWGVKLSYDQAYRAKRRAMDLIQGAGDYGGQLMAVVGRDGNNKIYVIAYAIMEVVTKDSWEWFIKILMEDLESINHREDAFISDHQKA
ncbi:hypothetical protein KIW84_060734 [Lathyrus oleraceus]|uniref:MULE transposase domain-containing protein n=1 Tax=Pisum sativum TaxID=3888 RepID=A0A9D5A377_PEA|nr:hypothetical protein KIW84_060734 [Pisum sativum]